MKGTPMRDVSAAQIAVYEALDSHSTGGYSDNETINTVAEAKQVQNGGVA